MILTIKARVAYRCAMAVIAAAGVLLVLAFYWLLRPYDNVSFTPFHVEATVAHQQGEIILLTDTFCWDGTPFLSARFFLGRISRVSAGTVEFPAGWEGDPETQARFAETGCAPAKIRLQIPVTLPPGLYRVEYEVSYRPNPIRTVTLKNTSNPFEVVETQEQS